jgi:hypothetical protein
MIFCVGCAVFNTFVDDTLRRAGVFCAWPDDARESRATSAYSGRAGQNVSSPAMITTWTTPEIDKAISAPGFLRRSFA